MRRITVALHGHLPAGYADALAILRQALPLLGEQGFEKMVFPDYVDVYGRDEPELSLDALEAFTQEVPAEFAVRPFIERYPHPGVRRLAEVAWITRHALRTLVKDGHPPGATATTSRAHSFRPVTTRRYYPGPRAVQPQVNGDEDRPVPPIYTTAGKSYMIGGEGRNRHLAGSVRDHERVYPVCHKPGHLHSVWVSSLRINGKRSCGGALDRQWRVGRERHLSHRP